jgi:hypothetical protein
MENLSYLFVAILDFRDFWRHHHSIKTRLNYKLIKLILILIITVLSEFKVKSDLFCIF